MDTYWACFRTNADIACSGDPALHVMIDNQTGAARLNDFRTPDSRKLEIDLVAEAESPEEAEAAMEAWLGAYLRKAEWIGEIGVYDSNSNSGADFHEPADVFHRCGFEVRSPD